MKTARNNVLILFVCCLTAMVFSVSVAGYYGLGKEKVYSMDTEANSDAEETIETEKSNSEIKAKKVKVISDDDICHEITFVEHIATVKYNSLTTHTSITHSGFDKFVYSPPEI